MQYSKRDKITKKYDTIVIGGGLGGLTLANTLAKQNKSVLLLEAHNKLGGFATWFKRASGDHIFDVSLHGFPFGMLKTCKKYWSPEIAAHIRPIRSVRFVNPSFDIETDFTKEDYKKILQQKFHLNVELVEGFFNELATMNFYDDQSTTNKDLFEKYFPGRNDVLRFLLEPIVYANGSNLSDPAISYGIVFSNFMQKGVYVFEGGTDLMISMMKAELLKNGVDIRLHSKVDQILVDEHRKAYGVRCGDEIILSQTVVSNANLKTTIEKMVGESFFSPEYFQKMQSTRLNSSSCQVYLGIKSGAEIPFIGDLVFTSTDDYFSSERLLSPEIYSQTFSIYYPDMRPERGGRYTIVSSSNAKYSDWAHLTEAEYEAKKAFLIERALVELEKLLPGVRDKIDFVEAATPLTVEKFTHHQMGASFGTKFEGLEVSMNINKEVDGLFHAGSVGIIMSGWLGAANYGVIKAYDVLNYLNRDN